MQLAFISAIKLIRRYKCFSKGLLRRDVVSVYVSFCVLVLYGPFCHGALKLDLSSLFTAFFI